MRLFEINKKYTHKILFNRKDNYTLQIAVWRSCHHNPKLKKKIFITNLILIFFAFFFLNLPLAIGFNVETINYKNITLNVWDLGGQTSIRPYWRCYYANTNAIIYVVDSSDTDRIGIAKDELHQMLNEDELKNAVLLVFANKQDLPGAMSAAEVSEALELNKLKNRQWSIYKASAIQGTGLEAGLDWLVEKIKK